METRSKSNDNSTRTICMQLCLKVYTW